ncbi:MAG: protein kinase, partial [Myxococcaceae bacterium]|nr:protein kinase [Myxococcaceae bacterium]
MGTYHLGRRLVAASGVVEAYLGSRDDRWLVLSRLSAPWSQDATLLDRFGGPSRALATVYSDEVATLLEYGHGGDGFWLAESTGDGEPLRALMTSRVGRLSTGEAVAIAERVATALDALHGATTPVVHGDVSASSTFISSAGGVQLLHAGLACVAGAHPSRGPARSEPHAIAPEQLDGAPSSQTDVFRLGLLLLELLTGRSPYAETAPQQVLDHARQYQGLPACALEGVPDQLRVVLSLMMHRDPVHRPPASEVLSALQMAASALDLATGAEEVALAFHRLMSDRQPPMAARTTELRLTPPKMNTPPPVLPR